MEFPSLIQLHGAITHFPIALLLVAVAFDFGAAVFSHAMPERAATWRRFSLWLLGIAFVTSLPSLLTGWLYGRELARPPMQYQGHWVAAILATTLSGIVWNWRVWKRDILSPTARSFSLLLTFGGAIAVGWTGHLGGEMVFGSESEYPQPRPTPMVDRQEMRDQKLELFADKMALAAERLELSSEKLKISPTPKSPSSPQMVVRESAPRGQVLARPSVPTESLDRALEKLDRVAAKYDSVSQKLDRLVDQLARSRAATLPDSRPTAVATSKPLATQIPMPQRIVAATAPKTKDSALTSSMPTPTQPTLQPQVVSVAKTDAEWISDGKKYYFDSEISCQSCHKIAGQGGRGGPKLDGVGNEYPDVEWHVAHLRDPASKVPGSKMPAYNDVEEAKLRAIAHFMVSLK